MHPNERRSIYMKNELSWKEKYVLSLKESYTLKDIMMLRNCGMPTAREIRKNAIKYCLENNLEYSTKSVPSEAVHHATGKNIEYYYQKYSMLKKIL